LCFLIKVFVDCGVGWFCMLPIIIF
jgi:hypothetical protein